MTTLDEAWSLSRDDHGLAIVSTLRADETIQSSLVNAGVLDHPVTGERVLGIVTYGRVKLANLRARPQLAAAFRNGWRWATVEGRATLAGPDDTQPWLDPERLRRVEQHFTVSQMVNAYEELYLGATREVIEPRSVAS